jgi:hypothetical protein
LSALITPTLFLGRRWAIRVASLTRPRWWLVFSLSALITPTLFLGRSCGHEDRVADEATLVARLQFVGVRHADALFGGGDAVVMRTASPTRPRWWLVFSLLALVAPTFFVGRRCGQKDRVADEAKMVAHLQFVGANHADALLRETLWS